jgi:hypothetical protein
MVNKWQKKEVGNKDWVYTVKQCKGFIFVWTGKKGVITAHEFASEKTAKMVYQLLSNYQNIGVFVSTYFLDKK